MSSDTNSGSMAQRPKSCSIVTENIGLQIRIILTTPIWHHLALTFWTPSKEAEVDKNVQWAIDSEVGNKDLRARQGLEERSSISVALLTQKMFTIDLKSPVPLKTVFIMSSQISYLQECGIGSITNHLHHLSLIKVFSTVVAS